MFILAHISDIHLNTPLSISDLSIKRIIGLANWHFNRKKTHSNHLVNLLLQDIQLNKTNHIVITGDLVNLTSKREIISATRWLENVGTPYNVSIVPGNHDAYVRGAYAKAMHAWKAYIAGDSPQEGKALFPYLRIRNKVALIGCSTAIASPPFMANGYFSRKQAQDLAQLLRTAHKNGLFCVIMIHHPPILHATSIYKRMLGIRRFTNIINKEGAELILHGHTHLNTVHWLPGPKAPVPVVGIASAAQNINQKKPKAAYNLFYIEGYHENWKMSGERHSLTTDGMSIYKECPDIFLKKKSCIY